MIFNLMVLESHCNRQGVNFRDLGSDMGLGANLEFRFFGNGGSLILFVMLIYFSNC